MMASRVTLDSQGRLILRENGKIILPFEHFANAVMLKHMNGPHGLHLGVEATVRAVRTFLLYKRIIVICNCKSYLLSLLSLASYDLKTSEFLHKYDL